MITKYSSSAIAIAKESKGRVNSQSQLYPKQKIVSQHLLAGELRELCILCGSSLVGGSVFLHRDIPYFYCETCNHIQSKFVAPANYPQSFDEEFNFKKIYPQLNKMEYNSRRERVYTPKFLWLLNSLLAYGYQEEALKEKRWIELGCGAGYFLSVLDNFGAKNFTGYDINESLVKEANTQLGRESALCLDGSLTDILQRDNADIYVAFFVLEHSLELNSLMKKLESLPIGTIFIFSVPVFGFSCLIEDVFKNHYARCLENVVHTQIFTEKSIEYMMDGAGYEIIAQWIFGQDAEDLIRNFIAHSQETLPLNLTKSLVDNLEKFYDECQLAIDKVHLSDQRHVIAIKK